MIDTHRIDSQKPDAGISLTPIASMDDEDLEPKGKTKHKTPKRTSVRAAVAVAIDTKSTDHRWRRVDRVSATQSVLQ